MLTLGETVEISGLVERVLVAVTDTLSLSLEAHVTKGQSLLQKVVL